MKRSIMVLIMIFAIIVLLIFLSLKRVDRIEKEYKQNGVIINSISILGMSHPIGNTGGTYEFRCKFNFDDTSKVMIAQSNINKNLHLFIGRVVPGIYSLRFDKLKLLMLPEDFAKYGLPYPDSLRWVDSLNRSQ